MRYQKKIDDFILAALNEDIGEGDHSSLACIPLNTKGKACIYAKQNAIVAGAEVARKILNIYDKDLKLTFLKNDGDFVKNGGQVIVIEGHIHSILSTERLVLNFLQRMSGIATFTNHLVSKLKGLPVKVLDTRKTTPCLRYFEKWAVQIGGGYNHRFGLFDMIMIKDNHIDYCGGIRQAIEMTNQYLKRLGKELKIVIEARSLDEVDQIMSTAMVDRILLDNFNVDMLHQAVKKIDKTFETEASGGINEDNIRKIAETGVDYISIGALTHQLKSVDMSLLAEI